MALSHWSKEPPARTTDLLNLRHYGEVQAEVSGCELWEKSGNKQSRYYPTDLFEVSGHLRGHGKVKTEDSVRDARSARWVVMEMSLICLM